MKNIISENYAIFINLFFSFFNENYMTSLPNTNTNPMSKISSIVTETAIITGYRSVKHGGLLTSNIIPDAVAVGISRMAFHDYITQKAGEYLHITDENIKEFAGNSLSLGLGFVGSDMLFGDAYSVKRSIGEAMLVSGVNFLVKDFVRIEG